MTAHVALSARQRGAALLAKRALDITVAGVALVLLSPLMALTALAIRLDSPGPALFRQQRVGRQARPFVIWKFRSMRTDGGEELHQRFVKELLTAPARPGAPAGDGAAAFKLADDPRITRVGRIIRATSIDELPQLFNVLTGTMSLVGPRPDVPYAVEEYPPWAWRRFAVLPGVTGLWQVSGRGQLSPVEMLELDVAYVDRWSLLLDVALLARTIPAVLRKVGSG